MISLAILAALLAGCVLPPGLAAARRLGLGPLPTACCAIGLSLFLIYVGGVVIYLCGLPPAAWYVLTGLLLALGLAGARHLRFLAADPELRALARSFALLSLWTLAVLATVRNFAAGHWAGDWQEHYERALFYIHAWPLDTLFTGSWLPARPPLMNVVTSFFLVQAGEGFAQYQVVSAALSLLAFWPAALVARTLAPSGRRLAPVLAALLAFNPTFVQNCVYPWTKLLAAFYVLLGVVLYLDEEGDAERRKSRQLIGFASLCLGCLVHYSAATYLLFVGLHYLAGMLARRAVDLRQLALVALLGLVLLGSWIGWSLAHYGPAITFGSNTSVVDSRQLTPGGNVIKVLVNLRNTIVPHTLHSSDHGFIEQPSAFGFFKDSVFLMYVGPLTLSAGSVGWLLLLGGPLVGWRPPPWRSGFWLGFLAFNLVLGVAVHGSESPYGVAHVCHQPLTLLMLAMLAAWLPGWRRSLQIIASLGLAIDLTAGILLPRFYDHKVFAREALPGGRVRPDMSEGLSTITYVNWIARDRAGLVFLGDHFSGTRLLLPIAAGAASAFFLGLGFVRALAPRSGGPPPSTGAQGPPGQKTNRTSIASAITRRRTKLAPP